MIALVIGTSILLLCLAVAALFVRSLGSAVIFLGSVSLLVSATFLLLGAPDVAITEAAIGSALTTLAYVLVMRRSNSVDSLEDIGTEKAAGRGQSNIGIEKPQRRSHA